MKRLSILLLWALVLFSCKEAEDTRYFAPELRFEADACTVSSSEGGADVCILFSRPATVAFQVRLIVSASLQEGVQFSLPSHTLEVPAGASEAWLHLTLVDDEIWDRESYIDLMLTPGDRYTVDPAKNCTVRVNVTKNVVIPVLKLSVESADAEINPYIPVPITLKVSADNAPLVDTPVQMTHEGLTIGEVILPAGATSVSFDVTVPQMDRSGYDVTVPVTLLPQKGKYGVGSEGASVDVHLYDPVPVFKPIFKTAAAQDGQGYVIRQAIKKADGSWDGNTTVDLGVSSEGSCYLRNFRNMYDHPSFGCRANASVSQFLRMSDFFPTLLYPNATAILDYGNDQGHREFSPADSLMRFVLDKGETGKGRIYLNQPRSFKAYIGSYAAWQDKGSGTTAWVKDSKATGGDIDASTHAAITGSISVTLERLEGTFDFSDASEPILVTAWLRSDSDAFMKADEVNGKDPVTTYGLVQEDGLWKVEYKLWPR
jgi:hypothetical protein